MKKLYFTLLILIVTTSQGLMGQHGNKQAGMRMGYRGGIFYQLTSDSGNAEIAYNAMLGFRNNGIQLTGLRIVYETSLSEISPDLFFAWGYGGHVGFIHTDHLGFLGERYNFTGERFCPVIGADGWLAAEYRFRDIPLNISLNIKPFVELTIPSFVKIMPADLGLSISYVF
ncbi:MAG: hypothetical protein WCS03_02545 [Bacteroidota bacterium]